MDIEAILCSQQGLHLLLTIACHGVGGHVGGLQKRGCCGWMDD